LSYANEMWEGEEVAAARAELAEKTLTDITKFIGARVHVEEKYAKLLGSKTSKVRSEGGTIGVGWQSIRDQQNHQLSTNYEHFSQKMLNDIVNPMEARRKQHFNDKSKLSNDFAQLKKEHKRREAELNDKKTHYYKCCEALEKEKRKLDESSKNPNYPPAKLTKLQTAVSDFEAKQQQARKVYMDGVADFNAFKKKYEDGMRLLLSEYQNMDQRRLETIRDSLQAYIKHIDDSASSFLQFCDACRDQLATVSATKDMKEYLEGLSQEKPPKPDQYEEYRSGSSNSAVAGEDGEDLAMGVVAPGYQPLPKISLLGYSRNRVVRAQYDFAGSDGLDLKFSYGDVIVVIKEDESGWCVGELMGRRGLFPLCMVKAFGDEDFVGAHSFWPPQGYDTLVVQHDFAGEEENELSAKEGDILIVTGTYGEWCTAESKEGRTGLFPLCFALQSKS